MAAIKETIYNYLCLVSLIAVVVWSSLSNAFSSWRGRGDPTTAAKETFLWPTADFGIIVGEKSKLTAVILAGNFNGANEGMVRTIPWLTWHVC